MQLSDFLDFEAVRVDLSAGNKRQLLDQIEIAAARLALDPSTIADSIAERERLGSTGFGGVSQFRTGSWTASIGFTPW